MIGGIPATREDKVFTKKSTHERLEAQRETQAQEQTESVSEPADDGLLIT